MRNVLLIVALVLGVAVAAPTPLARQPASPPRATAPAARPLTPPAARTILALYKGSEGDTDRKNLVREHAEPILLRQGYRLTYRNADDPLPDEPAMKPFTAVITWFRSAKISQALAYPTWLTRQIRAGRKVIILGNFGAFTPDEKYWTPNNYLNEFFYPFGLEYFGEWTNKGTELEIVSKDPKMVEREVPLNLAEINHYYRFAPRHPENKAFLTVRRKDQKESTSALIVRTPFGAFALESYLYRAQPDGTLRWRLDLPKFLAEALSYVPKETRLPAKKILAFYKSSEGASEWDNEIRRFLWQPLYDLGFWVTFRDVEKEGLPTPAETAAHAAVITWFRGGTMTGAADYCRWLADRVGEGKKVVILGNFGAFQERFQEGSKQFFRWLNRTEYNNFFYPFGLEFMGNWTSKSDLLEVVTKDPAMVEADIPLSGDAIKHYFQFKGINSENRPYFVLRRKDMPGSESQIVVETPRGGFALESYLYAQDPKTWAMQWRVNMPAFLKAALLTRAGKPPVAMPVPDPSLMKIPSDAREIRYPKYPETLLPESLPELPRVILALHKGSEKMVPDKNLSHQYAEQPLNWLGVKLFHYNIEEGLPDDAMMEKFFGILTWYNTSQMADPESYWKWLSEQVDKGKKVVIMGNAGALTVKGRGVPTRGAGGFFRKLGLRYLDEAEAELEVLRRKPRSLEPAAGGEGITILEKDPAMTEFERPLNPKEISSFSKLFSEDPTNKVYLRASNPRIGEFTPVVTGRWGGIVEGDFTHVEGDPEVEAGALKEATSEQEGKISLWRINPFRFFEEAFGLAGLPRPDVTTLNGSRIFYSHIDGDGFPGISLIDKSSLSAKFVRDEVLMKYNLPVTVSVISKDIEARGEPFYNQEYLLAKSIFALPNVEGATHTFSHPFSWRTGDLKVTATSPLNIERFPIDLEKEIVYSINYINRFLLKPFGKKLEILLWSGDCYPDARAVALVDAMGVRNMNGGDPVYDTKHPTYGTLCALTSQVGERTQYYTSARGDFLYTDGWTRNFGGMKEVTEHFDRTESPRRVMPLNIYYHFYIGDRMEGLKGLQAAYDYCVNREIAPLFASQYVDIVKDYMSLRIFKIPDGWRVVNSGDLRTIRFDAADGAEVDLARSRGVLGFSRRQGSLYVALDDGMTHDIILGTSSTSVPYLVQASHYLDNWKVGEGEIRFEMRGLGPARVKLGNLSPGGRYAVEIRRIDEPQETILTAELQADPQGTLLVKSELKGYRKRYAVLIRRRP